MNLSISIVAKGTGKLKRYKENCTEDFNSFVQWITPIEDYISFDVETNVVESVLERKLKLLQYYVNGQAFVIFFEDLTEAEQKQLLTITASKKLIIQNLKFEYVVFRHYGVRIEKVYDTYLAQKVLTMGLETERNSLAEILKYYTDIIISKDLQTSFDDITDITDLQIEYALNDVIHLHKVKKLQLERIKNFDSYIRTVEPTLHKTKGLYKTLWWTTEFVKSLGDMEYDGILMDTEKWKAIYEKNKPKVEQAIKDLNDIFIRDFRQYAADNGFYIGKDTFSTKLFSSTKQKHAMLSLEYANVGKTSQVELKKVLVKVTGIDIKPTSKKLVKYCEDTLEDNKDLYLLKCVILGEQMKVKRHLYANHRDKLIEDGLLTPAGTCTVNWASPAQKLKIFRLIEPSIESTDRITMENIAHKHELIKKYIFEYQKYNGYVTKFGLKFLDKLDTDGRIRTHFNPMLNTSRIGSSSPNLLQIPSLKEFRDCFIAGEGNMFGMSDFVSEEVIITALESGEPVWLEAIKKGYDMHSVNGEKIFGKQWADAALPNCEFKLSHQKCECPEHKEMRNKSKVITFSTLYGISKFGLAARLDISEEEADKNIKAFFKSLPHINDMMKTTGSKALKYKFTIESVLGACRFVDPQRVHYDGNSIKRTSGNYRIQGAGASILKILLVLIRRDIRNNNRNAWLIITPYDEAVMEFHEAESEYWKVKLKYYMELAAALGLNSKLLKADTPAIDNHWVH